MDGPRIAVLIPCLNEEATVGNVVRNFQSALPKAAIYVFDNDSTDKTAQIASQNEATVQVVGLKGKGNVVRRLFADIDADIYVMADGDDTYDADSVTALIDCLREERHDMVVAVRRHEKKAAYRTGHLWGNWLLTTFLSRLFGRSCRDILSGYRVFSRRFVKSFPVLSAGFDIETELTVHALELKMSVGEIETPYKERPQGSASKLSTYKDGFRILRTMLVLFSSERPFAFFGGLGVVLAMTGLMLGIPVVSEFMATGMVPRFPTAILATGLMILAALSGVTGLVLDNVTRGRREMKLLAYLRLAGPK